MHFCSTFAGAYAIMFSIIFIERYVINMLNAAMLSRWHVHAKGYAKELLATGKVNITAVWDEDEVLGRQWADELGAEFIADLDILLARKDIDAVICDTPTTMHTDVLLKAANSGKHIFTEKTLACTVEECEQIAQAVKKNNVVFTISMPHKAWPVVRFAKQCIDNGDFGKVTTVRIRNAHNGVSGGWLPDYWFIKEDCAGGAMMDLGCHPMYLLAYLCGKPKRVASIFNSILGTPVDENAVTTVEFDNGCIGISETSFLAYSSPYTIEVHGTEGILLSHNGEIKFKTTKTASFQKGFITPDNLPEGLDSPINRFVDACINGTGSPDGLDLDSAIDLARLLENAYISNDSNTIVSVEGE